MSFLRCVYLEACLMKVTKLHLCGSIGRRPFILLMTVSDLKILFVGSGLLYSFQLKMERERRNKYATRE
jgi:hypothetical protein